MILSVQTEGPASFTFFGIGCGLMMSAEPFKSHDRSVPEFEGLKYNILYADWENTHYFVGSFKYSLDKSLYIAKIRTHNFGQYGLAV